MDFEYLVNELEDYYQKNPELRPVLTSQYEQYVAEVSKKRRV